MTSPRRALGLRRDLARVHTEIRAADHAGRYRLALALTDEAAAIRTEIEAAESLSDVVVSGAVIVDFMARIMRAEGHA